MPFITYPQENGQVAVIIPADASLSIEEIAAKDVPEGLPFKIVDDLSHVDNDYFNAYEFHPDLGASVNIDRAKEIHLDKFRAARAPKLASLDVAFMQAVEKGSKAKQTEIAGQKQVLRDITTTPLPDTLDEIKAVWPECLN